MPGYTIAKNTSKRAGGNYDFWVLRQAYYDKAVKASKNRYICYLGVKPILSESKAREISEKYSIPPDELRNVTNLTIIPDCEFERRTQARRDEQAKARKAKREARRLAKELSSNDKPNNKMEVMGIKKASEFAKK